LDKTIRRVLFGEYFLNLSPGRKGRKQREKNS
jgi:hypothetical protein